LEENKNPKKKVITKPNHNNGKIHQQENGYIGICIIFLEKHKGDNTNEEQKYYGNNKNIRFKCNKISNEIKENKIKKFYANHFLFTIIDDMDNNNIITILEEELCWGSIIKDACCNFIFHFLFE